MKYLQIKDIWVEPRDGISIYDLIDDAYKLCCIEQCNVIIQFDDQTYMMSKTNSANDAIDIRNKIKNKYARLHIVA